MMLRAQLSSGEGEPPRTPRDEAEERAWVVAAHEASLEDPVRIPAREVIARLRARHIRR